MKKKLILSVLLGGIVLISIFSFMAINRSRNSEVKENYVQSDEILQDKIEVSENINNKEEKNIEEVDEEVDVDIKDETFITQMDDIFTNIDKYLGKTIRVEGIVSNVDKEQFAVIRLYDMYHEDHTHEITVGVNAVYNGEELTEDTWVCIMGKIESGTVDGRVVPIVNVEKLDKKFSWGQSKVYN